jgi:hypothetical protein
LDLPPKKWTRFSRHQSFILFGRVVVKSGGQAAEHSACPADIDDGIWHVSCGPLTLGRLHDQHRRIEDKSGSLSRHKTVVFPISPAGQSLVEGGLCLPIVVLPDLVWLNGIPQRSCDFRDIPLIP